MARRKQHRCRDVWHHRAAELRFRSGGPAAILATFVPSYLAYAKVLPAGLVDSIKIFVPMLAGTVAAIAVGLGVGMAFRMSPHDVFFFALVPARGGGVGEGASPLSIAYGVLLQQDQGVLLARILPAVMFASLTAIVLSGWLNQRPDAAIGPAEVATAGITAVCLDLVGLPGQTLFKFPGPGIPSQPTITSGRSTTSSVLAARAGSPAPTWAWISTMAAPRTCN